MIGAISFFMKNIYGEFGRLAFIFIIGIPISLMYGVRTFEELMYEFIAASKEGSSS